MKRKIIQNSIIKTQILVCLVLGLTNILANKSLSTAPDFKPPSDEAKVVNDKTDIKSVEQQNKIYSRDNYHEIMSTKGGCSASCCAGNGTVANINSSKKKSNNQKAKKKFGWFSRSK